MGSAVVVGANILVDKAVGPGVLIPISAGILEGTRVGGALVLVGGDDGTDVKMLPLEELFLPIIIMAMQHLHSMEVPRRLP